MIIFNMLLVNSSNLQYKYFREDREAEKLRSEGALMYFLELFVYFLEVFVIPIGMTWHDKETM